MSEGRPGKFIIIVLTLMLTDFVASLEASMIYGALPHLSRIFGGFDNAGWLITAFVLVQAGAAAIGGRLGDVLGRRNVLIAVLLLSAVGSLVSALGPTLTWVVAGRALQGISGAILPLSFGIIREHAGERNAALGVGIVVGAYSVSGALGYILGGFFADIGEWRAIFLLTAVLPLLVAVVIGLAIPVGSRDPSGGSRIDYVGALALAPGVAALLLAITLGGKAGWWTPLPLGLLGAGIVIIAFWTWFELQRDEPIVDLRRFREPRLALSVLSFFVLGIGALQMPLVLLALLQQPSWTGIGVGLTGAAAGLAKLPANVMGIVSGPLGGWLAGRISPRFAAAFGFVVLAVVWTTLIFWNTQLWVIVVCGIGCSVGVTVVMVAVPALIMERTKASETSEATGFAYLVRAVGMGVGAQGVAMLLASRQVEQSPGAASFPSEASFETAIAYVAATAFIGLMLIYFMPGRREAVGEQRSAPSPH